MTTVVVESPGRDSKRRRVQWHCPRAPTPEPGKGRRPKNRHSSKAKRVSALVFCLLPVLACLCRGFPGSGSLVLRPCSFGFLFVLVQPHVSFYWPRASRSSSRREGRRVKRRGTDPRTGTGRRSRTGFYRYPSTYAFVVYLVAPDLFFPFSFAMLYVVVLVLCSLYPSLPQLTHSAHLRRLHSVSRHPSFGWPSSFNVSHDEPH